MLLPPVADASMWVDIWSMFLMKETEMTSLVSPLDDCATLTERLQLLSDSQWEKSRVFLKDASSFLSFSPYNTCSRVTCSHVQFCCEQLPLQAADTYSSWIILLEKKGEKKKMPSWLPQLAH